MPSRLDEEVVPMLTCLRVKDLAIVEDLELVLGPGLSIITGETGAGKSILVDALELVLGVRGQPELVRAGAEAAEVEALFDLSRTPAVRERLAAEGIDVGDELVIRRVVRAEGRSRAYVGGRLASQRQLAALAAGLATISSQHAHHGLTEPRQQLALIDAHAGAGPQRDEMAEAHRAYVRAEDDLDDFERRARQRAEREDLLRYQLCEIDELAPVPGEDGALGEERERLAHADHLARVTGAAEEALVDAEDAVSAILARTATALAQAGHHDRALVEWAGLLDEARATVEDVAREAGGYARRVEADPGRLEAITERLSGIRNLARKHGGDVAALLERREQIARELGDIEGHDERVEALRRERDEAHGRAIAVARKLTAARRRASKRLVETVNGEFASLGMADAKLDVAIQKTALGPTGVDRVELVIAPNKGEAAHPLSRIASGGELSRILLAIKGVLADREPGGLHVFDEIDTGIGGAVAETVGRKLKAISRERQVLCITHLPQVAVFADLHYHVDKAVIGGRTVSRVTRLDGRPRLDALARMMGGARITTKTRAAAAELLQHATAA